MINPAGFKLPLGEVNLEGGTSRITTYIFYAGDGSLFSSTPHPPGVKSLSNVS